MFISCNFATKVKNEMILFPNAKINLGLHVLSRRKDGFHNIETVFYPVGLSDILEVENADKIDREPSFHETGISSGVPYEKNLCYKAFLLLKDKYEIPGTCIHLHKIIPNGAGLGGGSSDAAYMLIGLNSYYKLGLSKKELLSYAIKLGADCSFFIINKPVFAEGRGEKFSEIELSLKNYYLLIVKPPYSISTPEAYQTCNPSIPKYSLKEIIGQPVAGWKEFITNDFEKVMFNKYPESIKIKEQLYKNGALFALMSGSGSSFYGIFKNHPDDDIFRKKGFFTWTGILK